MVYAVVGPDFLLIFSTLAKAKAAKKRAETVDDYRGLFIVEYEVDNPFHVRRITRY